MDYLAFPRQHVGHALLQMVGAADLIVDEQDCLLLMKCSDSGCWGLPGGAVELGEVLKWQPGARFVKRPGWNLAKYRFSASSPVRRCFYVYPNGDEVYNVTIDYLACLSSGEAYLNDEYTVWRWFAPEEIPENISPPIQPVIARFVKADD